MEKIYHDLSLDFCENRSLQEIRIKQNDKFGRRIRLHFYNNGAAVAINSETDTATCYASINGIATAVGDACNIENNAVIIDVGLPMTSIAGTERCEVRVESANGRVHTATFNILVEPSTVTENTPKIINTADIFGQLGSWESNTAKTITRFIINGINALHPEYTQAYTTAKIGNESDKTVMTLDLGVYNPYKSDGLLITADGILIPRFAYATAVDGDAAVIRFFQSAGLGIGQMLRFYIYHKPEYSSGTVVGEAVAMSDGVISETVEGKASTVIDLLDYELSVKYYNSSASQVVPTDKWFSVSSNQIVKLVCKYDGSEVLAGAGIPVVGWHYNNNFKNSITCSNNELIVSNLEISSIGPLATVMPFVAVKGDADLSKLTEFYMIITEV